MGVKEAAYSVLSKAGRPLHFEEITRLILDGGLWATKGKTPSATVAAALYMNIKRNGELSKFVNMGSGVFGLREFGPAPKVDVARRKVGSGRVSKKKRQPKYSFTEAAEKVLLQQDDKKPMHYREITQIALNNGWLSTEGKTPEATMYAQVLSEIKRQEQRGSQPRFIRHGRGLIGLHRWRGTGFMVQVEYHNEDVHKAILSRLRKLDWQSFEGELVPELFGQLGMVDIEVTGKPGDGSVDVRARIEYQNAVSVGVVAQAKRWKKGNNVGDKVVRELRGGMKNNEIGIIITTGGFTSSALKEAKRTDKPHVELIDGERLTHLLVECEIWARPSGQAVLVLEEAE